MASAATPREMTAARSSQLSPPDGVTVLTCFAVLLYLVPADRRIEALGGAGAPAYLVALVALLWWAWHHLQKPAASGRQQLQWVRVAAFLFVGACLASYAKAALTALPAADISVADLGLVRIAALVGILLVANDAIGSEDRFMVLIRRLTLFAGLYATLGLFQFFTGMSIVDTWQIPGLSGPGENGIGARSGFVRSAATATHPLEYAVVLTMMLPFCLTVAIRDRSRPAFLRWFPVAVITLSTVLSVTRSALLAMAAVYLVLFPSWPPVVRRAAGATLALGAVAVYVAVPGMAGTILGMFSANDSSITSRTDSYDEAIQFFLVSPFVGRGFGTFLPAYRILDNQYLVSAVEIGIVGVLALLAIVFSAMAAAYSSRRLYAEEPMKAMGLALVASMLAGSLNFALFDAFAFPQACGTVFMVAGLCGAYANIGRNPAMPSGLS
ncbi:O-antigen ligase family protein [Arthrobacter sp. YAF17]|uniref:O-antigen ligase family protein n=1 Tax=Arthrobacter sp. YAF17 TaxID=3233077 RepID=UPI003F91463B